MSNISKATKILRDALRECRFSYHREGLPEAVEKALRLLEPTRNSHDKKSRGRNQTAETGHQGTA